MAISQVELQGQITRAQDFTTIKHNEDMRPAVEQAQAGETVAKEVEIHVRTVNRGQQTENQNKKFDAKEKGSNEYSGDGGQNRRNAKKEEDGKVILKSVGTTAAQRRLV